MIKYINVFTGDSLTEQEYSEMMIKDFTQEWNENLTSEADELKEAGKTLQDYLNYRKQYDYDTDFKAIDIEKVAEELKEKAENKYIDWCNNPERDEDGEWIKPSLSVAITLVLDEYFEEIEDDELYNKIEDMLENSLDERAIHESMAELKENYRGLTDHERNSGKY